MSGEHQRIAVLLSSTLCFFVPSAHAQNVFGEVRNDSGEAVVGAHVRLLDLPQSTATDVNGAFSFTLASGRYALHVSAIGHAANTQQFAVGDSILHLKVVLPARTYDLEQFVVSASKREETALSVPASVTVLSARKVQETRTWGLADLPGLVPNLQYGDLGVGYQQQVALRGISIFSETPAVATYVDGVIAFDVAANGMQLMDIERIEVLRGPQGTLYGRNALAGVISIITKKPTNTPRAFVESSIGNQGLQRYGFSYSAPLVKNKLFIGLSGQWEQQHGFYINDLSDQETFLHEPLRGTPEDGVRMGDAASQYGNLTLRWLASGKTSITLNAKAQHDASIGASAYYQAVENDTLALSGPYRMAVNSLGSNERVVANASVAVDHRGRAFRFLSTTTYQYVGQSYEHLDQDLYPYALSTGSTFNKQLGDVAPQHVIGQELRLASTPERTRRLKWTAGTYLFAQLNDKRYAAVYEELALFFGIQPGTEVTITDQRNTGAALFGQVDYAITEKLTVVGGLRGDVEQRNTDVARYYLNADGSERYTIAPTRLSSTYDALSPKVAVRFSTTANSTLYASYARGFRAGGNNMFTAGRYPYYAPEYSDNFEVGYKFRSRDQRVTLSSCLFMLDWRDMQLDTRAEAGVWIIDNIGTARSMGGELEVNAQPFLGTEIDLALGVNDARYGSFDFLGEDIGGNQAILAPKSTLMLALQQALPLGRKALMMVRGEWRRMGAQYFDLVNAIEQPAYSVINARLDITTKRWGLSLWGRNMGESTYIAFAMPGYFRHTLLNRPRTFGATLTIRLIPSAQ